jgi:hypothetical protein
MRTIAERAPRRGQRRHTADARIAAVAPDTGRPLLRLLVLASITVSFLAGSSAPTPLYATYQAAWGFSARTTTVVFSVYATTSSQPCSRQDGSPTTSEDAQYYLPGSPLRSWRW